MINVRPEHSKDVLKIYSLNAAAFGTDAEAGLVDALREQASSIISLVAEREGELVGHIFFSPVTLPGHNHLKLFGLAPMAVLPEFQQQGIGSQLVTEGLERCHEQGGMLSWFLDTPSFIPDLGLSRLRSTKLAASTMFPMMSS